MKDTILLVFPHEEKREKSKFTESYTNNNESYFHCYGIFTSPNMSI